MQGRGTEMGRRLVQRVVGDAKLNGEVRTCCVFLPEDSWFFGKHDGDLTSCWCSRTFADGGLEYVLDGKPKLCKPEDVETVEWGGQTLHRANFGCLWYVVWKHQVLEAHRKGASLVVVVPDDSEPGFSQRGEINYLEIKHIPYDTKKLSKFILEIKDFMHAPSDEG